jgi:hypothetical protein
MDFFHTFLLDFLPVEEEEEEEENENETNMKSCLLLLFSWWMD